MVDDVTQDDLRPVPPKAVEPVVAQVPPRLDTGKDVAEHPYLKGVPTEFQDGMGKGFFDKQAEAAQTSNLQTWKDTLNQSAINSAWDYFKTTPDAVNELLDTGSAELEQYRDELTKDVPLHLQDNIMASMTLVGAKAKRLRILEDVKVQSRLAQQTGLSKGAIKLAAGLLDADLPLMFASGGTLAAARTAANVAKAAKFVGAANRVAQVAGDAAVGVSGGALAGLIVGGVSNITRDDMDVNGLFQTVLAAAATGGILNPVVGRFAPDQGMWSEAAKLQMKDEIGRLERNLQKQMVDPDSALNRATSPVNDVDAVTRPSPKLFEINEDGSVGADIATDSATDTSTAGAQSLGTAGRQITKDALGLKDAGATDSIVVKSVEMQNWRKDYDYQELYDADTADPFVRTLVGGAQLKVKIPMTSIEIPIGQIAGTIFTLGQRDFTALVHSRAPSANFVAAEILESASGLVRSGSSAAVLREMFHGSAMVHSAETLVNSKGAFFKRNGLNPMRLESHRQFTRTARLQMDEYYRTGKKPKGAEDLIDALDKTHLEILGHMKGISDEVSVRGAREIEHRGGYFRYDWEPKHFLRVREQVGEDAMVQAFRDGYMKASGLDKDLSTKLGRAVVRRFADRALGVGAADSRLLDIDSRAGIEAVLEGSGLPAHEIKSIMIRLDVNTQERAVKGFLKHRTDVDLQTKIPGTNLQLVDLMTDDLERSVQQYVGDAAGSAALAHKGLRDKADVSQLMDTIMFEQSAAGGADITRPHLEAIFSQFTGGAHKGMIMGHQTTGVSPVVSMLTKATRASLLQRVGLTQLMDSANMVVANGLANSMEPVMARLGFDRVGKMTKAQLKNLHGELESLAVIVGQDHMLFRPHLSIDETEVANNVYMQMGQAALNTVERATNYASGQIHVTQAQQMIASAATATNIMRTIAGEATNLTPRKLRDIGLQEGSVNELYGLIQDGIIKVDGGRVELNSKQWSDELRLEFGAAITRTNAQQVQKGLIGETSVWMNTDIGKLLSSLKTFGMVATQKQAARNIMIGGKSQFLGAAAWQLGFAYSVLSLSQAVQGVEMGAVDRARLAVAYTPTLGVMPMVVDPITTMLGFDDLNFSPYGRYSSYLDSPVFEQSQKLLRAPGAIADMVTGNGTYDDMKNAQSMFMLNWYGMKRVWEAM